MPQTLVKPISRSQRNPRPRKRQSKPSTFKKQRLDAATIASKLQLQEQHRDLIYSLIALVMKLGLIAIGGVSLIKLGLASHQRVERHAELTSLLNVESAKLRRLQNRFDRLFAIGGERRLMDEQDHWIAPDRVRVVWR